MTHNAWESASSGSDADLIREYTCGICLEVPVPPNRPVLTSECGHLFCEDCILKHFGGTTQGTCPECRTQTSGHYCKRTERKIGTLRIKCPNADCTWKKERSELRDHLVVCPEGLIFCPRSCGVQIKRKDLNAHDVECAELDVVCPNSECQVALKRKDVADHLLHLCPEEIVVCPNDGCDVDMKRKDANYHYTKCPETLIKCRHDMQKFTYDDSKFGCQNQIKRKDFTQHLLDCPEVGVRCENRPYGCTTLIKRKDVTRHRMSCGYTTLVCDSEGCGKTFLRKDQKSHEGMCPFRFVHCYNGCGAKVQRKKMDEHHDSVCPEGAIPCPNCNAKPKRKNLEDHLQCYCPEAMTRCPRRCGAEVKRKLIREHETTTCPEVFVHCPVEQCTMQIRRGLLPQHTEDFKVHHLELRLEALQKRCESLEAHNRSLQENGANGASFHDGSQGQRIVVALPVNATNGSSTESEAFSLFGEWWSLSTCKVEKYFTLYLYIESRTGFDINHVSFRLISCGEGINELSWVMCDKRRNRMAVSWGCDRVVPATRCHDYMRNNQWYVEVTMREPPFLEGDRL